MVNPIVDPPLHRPRPTPPDPAKLRRAVYIGVRTVHRQAQDMLYICAPEEGTNAKQHLTPDDVKQLREQVRLAQQALHQMDQHLEKL